jgi:cardiolipin synthase
LTFLTVPNVVSLIRLATVPYFLYVLVGERRVVYAAILILIIGTTDWVDGYLARRLHQVSEMGKLLDPLADRLMIVAALSGGLVVGVIPAVLAIALLAREGLVLIGAAVLAGRGLRRPPVRYLGKAATFLLYGAVPAFYLARSSVAVWLFTPIAWLAGITGLTIYWYVGGQYLGDAIRSVESSDHPEEA